jgi:UDP-N-acetyl-D-mannosaminuronic acid dehydrogenase
MTAIVESIEKTSPKRTRKADIVIIGGAGHVGLPLGLAFADRGKRVILYDLNQRALDSIGGGEMPFVEYEADPILKSVLGKTLMLSSDINDIGEAEYVIVTIDTPVDEYLNPKLRSLLELFGRIEPYLDPEQTVIIRSTVYPGTNRAVRETLANARPADWKVAYCPERIAQGYAIRELRELPQLVSGLTEDALRSATDLFNVVSPRVMPVSVEEAELAKLFSNAWRYIQFAAANQFYMMSHDFGVDYDRVRRAMVEGYGRAASLPTAGFAAGPCLMKDTMQLAAFNSNNFMIGHAAMMVNEGMPGFVVEDLRKRYDLPKITVGILGMAFKADVDDIRDSLSFKLGKILRFHGANVKYSDEFASDPTFIGKEELVQSCDVVVIGAPHSAYKTLQFPAGVDVVNLWGMEIARETEA